PLVKINKSDFYVFLPAITFLEAKKINNKDFICNIASSRNEIISALDAIVTNT
ncbi:TPA: CcdB family protein, partial [Citrobacter freundii]